MLLLKLSPSTLNTAALCSSPPFLKHSHRLSSMGKTITGIRRAVKISTAFKPVYIITAAADSNPAVFAVYLSYIPTNISLLVLHDLLPRHAGLFPMLGPAGCASL